MSEPSPAPTHVVVATHGHCFDGMCSAAIFTRLIRHVKPGPVRFVYHAVGYGPGQNGVDSGLLSGDENAILDFRFSTSPKLTWYFDHHISAFPAEADRATYLERTRRSERTFFHDGAYGSCTKLIADIGAEHFGLDPAPTRELVRWADMIDSAAFPSAEMAVARREPVLQLMTVVEHHGDSGFLARVVPRLLDEGLDAVANDPDIQRAFLPLRDGHQAFIEAVKSRAVCRSGVVLVDLTDQLLEVAGKFVTYALFPESAYSVLLTRSKSKCKLSIGYNPWSPAARRHNIASICERHGGGGHAVVGAISLPADKLAEAQALAAEIARELGEPPA